MADRLLAPLDWIGHHLGHGTRVGFHYLTGQNSRAFLACILGAITLVFFVLDMVILSPPTTPGGTVFIGVLILSMVGFHIDPLLPVARILDRGLGTNLPSGYRGVRAVGRWTLGVAIPWLALCVAARAPQPPTFLMFLFAACTDGWVAIDLDDTGTRTLAGDTRRVFHALTHRPSPALIST